jgi:hypothetical protein
LLGHQPVPGTPEKLTERASIKIHIHISHQIIHIPENVSELKASDVF